MATISITRQHNKSTTEIEDLVEELRRVLERNYSCRCSRDGDEMAIERRGVSGLLKLGDKRVDVDITLGPMMAIVAKQLTPFIEAQLDAHLGDD